MLTNVTAKGDNLAHTESHSGRGGNASNDQNSLRLLTQRFRDALAKGVEGIVEAGKVLIEAKNKLPHGDFTDWVDRDFTMAPQRRRAVARRIYAKDKC